jgi:hypothetical protein
MKLTQIPRVKDRLSKFKQQMTLSDSPACATEKSQDRYKQLEEQIEKNSLRVSEGISPFLA